MTIRINPITGAVILRLQKVNIARNWRNVAVVTDMISTPQNCHSLIKRRTHSVILFLSAAMTPTQDRIVSCTPLDTLIYRGAILKCWQINLEFLLLLQSLAVSYNLAVLGEMLNEVSQRCHGMECNIVHSTCTPKINLQRQSAYRNLVNYLVIHD